MFGAIGLPVIAKVSLESLFTPRALERVGDGSKRADTLVFPWILQVQRQCTVTTHTVTTNAHSAGVDLVEGAKDGLGQFFGDVCVHLVVLRPWGGCCVDVETRSSAEIIGIIFTLDANAPCVMSDLNGRSTCKYLDQHTRACIWV